MTADCKAQGAKSRELRSRYAVVKGAVDFKWKGVKTLVYKPTGGGFKNIIRRVVVAGPGMPFEVRYFELRQGGYSSIECHRHHHAVIVLRGRGRVILKRKSHALKPFDAVYIGRGIVHQFRQSGNGPFGFLCVVSSKRDRPTLIGHKGTARRAPTAS